MQNRLGVNLRGMHRGRCTRMSYPAYSIVIPAYNEAARIGGALEAVVACIRERHWNAEVVVVDDGSRDRTPELVRAFAQSLSGNDNPEVRLAFRSA